MRRPISVLLGDLLRPPNEDKTFLYAAGCVGAYAAAALGERITVDVFRSPESLGEAFAACVPDVLGFTNYLWNFELSYEVIRQAKAAAPRAIVVMGGPNYPIDAGAQRAFLATHPLIDFYVYKEGEIPFLALLERLLTAELDPEASNPVLRARSFIYPATDPGVNPYLRRASFC